MLIELKGLRDSFQLSNRLLNLAKKKLDRSFIFKLFYTVIKKRLKNDFPFFSVHFFNLYIFLLLPVIGTAFT